MEGCSSSASASASSETEPRGEATARSSIASSGTCAPDTAARRVAVVGASLGGLAVANVFQQLAGFEVDVFERSASTMENKGSGLGFVDVNAWQQLRRTRMIRRGQQAHRSQGAFYYGDLWQYLYDGLPGGAVRFGRTIESLGDDPTRRPTIDGTVYDLVVLADGGWSALRPHVTSTQPYYTGYVVWRGLVDAAAVPRYNTFGVFKAGIYDTIVMPLAGDGLGRDFIVCGVFIATPEVEARPPVPGTARHTGSLPPSVPSWFLPFFRLQFGGQANGELVRLFEAVAASGKLSAHPQYDYAADSVHAGRLLLVGDAAHMASPRTAVGAHTAILDALALRQALEGDADAASRSAEVIDEALRRYAPGGVQRAAQLLQRAHSRQQRHIRSVSFCVSLCLSVPLCASLCLFVKCRFPGAGSQEVGRQFVPAGGVAEVVSPQLLLNPA